MSRDEVFKIVQQLVAEKLSADPSGITMETRFVEDLEADSLDLVELVMALEDKFGLHITDEEAEKIRSVAEAVNFIEEELKEKK